MLEHLPERPVPCAFCSLHPDNALLLETAGFYVIADHAPLAPAHLLLIPRLHIPCLAELPVELEDEFERLKSRLGRFVKRHYGCVTLWENGGIGQSVPHAHMHAFSWAPHAFRLAGAGVPFQGLPGLRALYELERAPYFVVEHDGVAQKLDGSFDVSRPILRSGEPALRLDVKRDERRATGTAWMNDVATRWRREFG
jgi:diadenosine tetraphosphate (Ap4A) HIT family hydrolase